MSVPRPSSSDAVHAQHDALLIAQQAAGDPLDPTQAREAAQLIASCRACAELAADLRSVSKAVAWEPVPSRRRDFRIDPAHADALRGSAWSRLLRRFAMPQGRALRPLAAGFMSLGLVLLIAGNAWPSAAPSTPTQPAVMTQASPAALEAASEASALPAVPPSELMVQAPAAVQEASDDQTTLTDVQALDAGRDVLTQELYAGEATASDAPARERDTSVLQRSDAAGTAATDPAAGVVSAMEAPAEEQGHSEPSPAGMELGAATLEEAVPLEVEVAPGVGAADGDTTDEGAAANQELKAAPAATTDGSSIDIDTIVIWVGTGLALAGALLLVLGWLSRRAADPLLR
jgi:hypothetical protein